MSFYYWKSSVDWEFVSYARCFDWYRWIKLLLKFTGIEFVDDRRWISNLLLTIEWRWMFQVGLAADFFCMLNVDFIGFKLRVINIYCNDWKLTGAHFQFVTLNEKLRIGFSLPLTLPFISSKLKSIPQCNVKIRFLKYNKKEIEVWSSLYYGK